MGVIFIATTKILGVLLAVGVSSAIPTRTARNAPINPYVANSVSTPNNFKTNGNLPVTQVQQPQPQPQQWNGGHYGDEQEYYETPRYYRNTQQNQYQQQPQYQPQYQHQPQYHHHQRQQRYPNTYEDDQPHYQYQGSQQYQNPPYYGIAGENNRQNRPYSEEDDDSYSMPMMEPIRRMYHVYEDNVRGFAKRFRNMVYAPMRMMG